MRTKKVIVKKKMAVVKQKPNQLIKNICEVVEKSKENVARVINQQLTLMYWQIGNLIRHHILQSKRAEYGEQIIEILSIQLTALYGKGWSKSQLWNCLYTVETFRDKRILSTLSGELSWSHFKEIIYLKDKLQRDFYIALCRHEHWSVRQLRERIDSMLYERTALSRKPGKLIKQELQTLKTDGLATPDLVFRDPYILNFLGLEDTYSEADFETAILKEIQRFIIELGTDFAFIARQKRIMIDNKDHSIDLLFYHRKLTKLVAIDLKLGKFKASYKGQMELYLKWLDKYERKPNEETPIGLILCSEKQHEQIELLELNKGNIRVAEYMTQLPSKKLLARKLHMAIKLAKNHTIKE